MTLLVCNMADTPPNEVIASIRAFFISLSNMIEPEIWDNPLVISVIPAISGIIYVGIKLRELINSIKNYGIIEPILVRQKNGKYLIIHADPANNWKITKYEDLNFEEAVKLPFVSEVALALVK